MIDRALTRQGSARERARRAAGPHGDARVLVIGAGVTGLTTALVLARRGRQVTVVADRFAPDVVSTVAGALWEWPPSVCGRHHDEPALEQAAGKPLLTMVENAVHARDAGQAAETEEQFRRAMHATSELGYL